VEAASRTLPKINAQSIEELIDTIFDERMEDGQLDDCPLTFQEIAEIKKSFSFTVLNMTHARTEYPDIKEKSRKSDSNPSFLSKEPHQQDAQNKESLETKPTPASRD
jgi:hypothetical protein